MLLSAQTARKEDFALRGRIFRFAGMTFRLILESVPFNSGQTQNAENRRVFIDKTTKNNTKLCGQSCGS
jgi:hypothetical protein